MFTLVFQILSYFLTIDRSTSIPKTQGTEAKPLLHKIAFSVISVVGLLTIVKCINEYKKKTLTF